MLPRITHAHLLGIAGFVSLPLAVFAPVLLSGLFTLVAVAMLVLIVRQRRWPARLPWLFPALFGALVAWGAVTALWAVDARLSLEQAAVLAAFGVGGFALVAAARGLDGAGRDTVLDWLAFGVVLGSGAFAVEIATGGALTRLGRDLLGEGGTFIYSVAYNRATAVLTLLVWPAALHLWRRGPRWLGPGLYLVACVLVTRMENMSSTVALFGGGGVFVATYYLRARVATGLAAVIVVGTLLVPLAPRTVLSPKLAVEIMPSISQTQFHRFLIWDFVADRIMERPLGGWGLDASRNIPGGKKAIDRAIAGRTTVIESETGEQTGLRIFSRRPSPDGAWEQLPLHPHNAMLQWWLELGLPGAVLGAALVAALFLACGRRPTEALDRATGVATVFSATQISALSYGIWQSWWLAILWLTATAMVAAIGSRAGPAPG